MYRVSVSLCTMVRLTAERGTFGLALSAKQPSTKAVSARAEISKRCHQHQGKNL